MPHLSQNGYGLKHLVSTNSLMFLVYRLPASFIHSHPRARVGNRPTRTGIDKLAASRRVSLHPSFSAHFAFMARRIAFGAGAAAAFFMPLRIARIALAILKRGGDRLLLLRVWRTPT